MDSNGKKAVALKYDGESSPRVIAKADYEMAEAMKHAVISGRKSFLSGRINPSLFGSASTTNSGII